MTVLSEEAVAGLWVEAGGPIAEAPMAVAVSTEESGRNTDAVNPQSNATGLMQIHPGGEQYKDPRTNMKAAVGKWRARGWQPWSVCGSGPWSAGEKNCPKLSGKANAVARRIKAPTSTTQLAGFHLPGGGANPWNRALDGLEAGKDIITGHPKDAIGDLVDVPNPLKGIDAVADAIRSMFNLLRNITEKIADPNSWADALKILVGLSLLYIGMKRTFELTK